MINNHILAMSGAVYWLGAIFFVKDNGVFCNLWMVPPCRSLESSSPPEPDQSKSLYTPESVQNQCLLEKYSSRIFFRILSYDFHVGDHGFFLGGGDSLNIFFLFKSQYYLKYSYMQKQNIFVLNVYIQNKNTQNIHVYIYI